MKTYTNKKERITGWLLTTPYLLYTIVFFIVPFAWAGYLAFTDWNLISPKYKIVGFANFINAFNDPGVKAAFFVSFKFMFMFVPAVIIFAMLAALIVYYLPKYRSIFIIGYFLPYLASGVASSIVVRGLLSYDSAVNIWLRNTWNINIDWLHSATFAPAVIVLMMVWKFTGYYALIIQSGLESVPMEVYEAADIDGVTGFKRFWKITLPLLYPALLTVVILAIGVSFHIFTEPYVLTNGGPNNATNTWYIEIYNQAFNRLRTGYGSTIAIYNAVVTFISIFVIRNILEKWGERHGW